MSILSYLRKKNHSVVYQCKRDFDWYLGFVSNEREFIRTSYLLTALKGLVSK